MKTMTLDEFKAQVNCFVESLQGFLDKYKAANPEWMAITLLQVIYEAIAQLKGLIENPEEKEITWDFPFVTLRYPVLADWEKVEPYYFTLTPEDLRTRDRLIEKFGEGFITIKKVSLFR